jgi:hypothetical protein
MDKITRLWANSGTKTAPTTTKQDAGWVNNEQVPHEWANWLQDKVEAKINEVIEERVNSYYDGASDHHLMLTTGLWDESWGTGADAANVISAGGTKEIVGVSAFFTTDGEPRLLLADNSLMKFEVWDPRSLTLLDTSGAMTDDLPSGGGETWEIYSMATDGTYVYGQFVDTNASPEEHHIQSWDLTLWNVRSGWAATGTALPGTGVPTDAETAGKIIIASGTKLACTQRCVVISAATSDAVSIITSADGTIDDSAAGDAPTGTSAQTMGAICSDGTYVYFPVSGGSAITICSASIANPQVGCGGTGFPRAVSGASSGEVVQCGSNLGLMFLYYSNAGAGPASTDIAIVAFNSGGCSNLGNIEYGQSAQATPLIGDQYIFSKVWDTVFDGINAWVFGDVEVLTGTPGNFQKVAVKIDAAKFNQSNNPQVTKQLSDIIGGRFIISPEVQDTGYGGGITFDGRDIWCGTEVQGSQTDSGKIFRLPLALLRG